MYTNQALYFPDTDIDIKKVFQDLLFFDHIYFYQAAENINQPKDDRWSGFCSGYPPLPFGPDLDRFKQLLKDLKGHEQEFYSGQLSGMALRDLESRDEKTVREIISSVSGIDNQARSPDYRDSRWHYRLLLKLAEIRRREEEELAEKLAGISEKEASLYDSLKGHPEIDRLLTGVSSEPSRMTDMTDIVLRAWGHLFINDKQHHSTLLTADKDAAESLFEAHSALSGARLPVRICRLSLPVLENLDEEGWLKIYQDFREKTEKVRAEFSELLSKVVQSGIEEDTLQKSTILAAEWGSMTEEISIPERRSSKDSCTRDNNSSHLEIYLCEHSPAALAARHCRLNPISDYADNNFGLIALKTNKPVTCMD
ncbi:MAG: hypothetical protein ACLFV2_07775 [Desulfurivibrionaceae bacterium]